jgi:methionine-rich copper-binding protein CopC
MRAVWVVVAVVVGLATAGCAPGLTAAPRLVAAWPAAGATLPVAAHTFELTFNHALRAESTWAAVWREADGSPLASEAIFDTPRRMRVRLQAPEVGQFRLHWHAVAARTAVAVDGEQDFSLQNESTVSPRLRLSRATAESGDKLELSGSGFGPRSAVRLTIGDDELALTTVDTDAHGTFDVEARVPAGVPFGMQPVSAVDAWGDSATAALQVRWGGWPPLVAYTVGQPGPGASEVTFTVGVRNRSDYVLERVRIYFDDPAGASFVAAQPSPLRFDGSLVWDVPSVDRGVVGPFRATYRVTGAVASHARIEFRHRRPSGCAGEDCLPAFISETSSDSAPVFPAD